MDGFGPACAEKLSAARRARLRNVYAALAEDLECLEGQRRAGATERLRLLTVYLRARARRNG